MACEHDILYWTSWDTLPLFVLKLEPTFLQGAILELDNMAGAGVSCAGVLVEKGEHWIIKDCGDDECEIAALPSSWVMWAN